MCGRFAQAQAREEYLTLFADDAERDIPSHGLHNALKCTGAVYFCSGNQKILTLF